MSFQLFVYGTLMRGQENHYLCHGATAIYKAAIVGRLYDLGVGYPMLEIPEPAALCHGSADVAADLRRAKDIARRHTPSPLAPVAPQTWVPGQLMIFDDPLQRVPLFDDYEDFIPGGPSLYFRVFAPVRCSEVASPLAWLYVRGDRKPPGALRQIERW